MTGITMEAQTSFEKVKNMKQAFKKMPALMLALPMQAFGTQPIREPGYFPGKAIPTGPTAKSWSPCPTWRGCRRSWRLWSRFWTTPPISGMWGGCSRSWTACSAMGSPWGGHGVGCGKPYRIGKRQRRPCAQKQYDPGGGRADFHEHRPHVPTGHSNKRCGINAIYFISKKRSS